MQMALTWLNQYGFEAVRHERQNSLKTPKMHFLPVFELMSDSLMTIGWATSMPFFCFISMKIHQRFLDIKDGTKFWWLPWLPAKNHPPQTFQPPAVYVWFSFPDFWTILKCQSLLGTDMGEGGLIVSSWFEKPSRGKGGLIISSWFEKNSAAFISGESGSWEQELTTSTTWVSEML